MKCPHCNKKMDKRLTFTGRRYPMHQFGNCDKCGGRVVRTGSEVRAVLVGEEG